jgi:hypothetical protein
VIDAKETRGGILVVLEDMDDFVEYAWEKCSLISTNQDW